MTAERERTTVLESTIPRERVLKKLRLCAGLFQLAYDTKRCQIRRKHPELDEREVNHRAYALIEKGCRR